MSDTFCILPWTHLIITPDGAPSACNWMGNRRIRKDGAPMSVYRHSLSDIWNSDEMCAMRHDMVRGKRVEACAVCYGHEDAGGSSLRQQMNQHWREGFLNEEGIPLEDLRAVGAEDGYRLSASPRYLELDLGNQCNLKCRMCAGGSSSRIARDPTHSKWAGESGDPLPPGQHWYRRKEIIRKILQNAEHLRHVHLIGGEPFIIREVGDILQYLIDVGAAPHVSLSCHTNATTVQTPWLELTRQFQSFSIWVSLDAFGPYFEYIRYPAKWEQTLKNLAFLRTLPNADVHGFAVLQCYNVLNIVELLRFLDGIKLPFLVYPVFETPFLQPSVLPAPVRRVAVERIRQYMEGDCRAENRWMLASLIADLEGATGEPDVNLLHGFMMFTNDLDVTRGQSFGDTHGELQELIAAAGYPWREDTLHAHRLALPVLGAS